VWLGTPCANFSAARWQVVPGNPNAPRPLRDYSYPWGYKQSTTTTDDAIPHLTTEEKEKLKQGNIFARKSAEVFSICKNFGNPSSAGKPSTTTRQPLLVRLGYLPNSGIRSRDTTHRLRTMSLRRNHHKTQSSPILGRRFRLPRHRRVSSQREVLDIHSVEWGNMHKMGETPATCQFTNKARPPPLQQQRAHLHSTNKLQP
jgi:hypothetical protein